MSDDDSVLRLTHGEELLEVLKRGRTFTESLLAENERLRLQVVRGESEAIQLRNNLEAEAAASRQENQQVRRHLEHLRRRFEQVEAENHDFAARYADVCEENESLANLYVASYRLHSTLDPSEVTEIICEILVELVGAEEFGLLLLDERTNELSPIRVEGSLSHYPAHIRFGEGPIGKTVRDGRPAYAEGAVDGAALAVIPLEIKGHPVGALVITRLLHRRAQFKPVARELLGLLAGHAATALMSSRLFAAADRKLKTIEGFMEMIKTGASAAREARG